jgi:hypothetical protein
LAIFNAGKAFGAKLLGNCSLPRCISTANESRTEAIIRNKRALHDCNVCEMVSCIALVCLLNTDAIVYINDTIMNTFDEETLISTISCMSVIAVRLAIARFCST